jgi:hypothetical protein
MNIGFSRLICDALFHPEIEDHPGNDWDGNGSITGRVLLIHPIALD